MQPLDYDGARHSALLRLEQELLALLSYHSLQHTRDGVVPAVERLVAWEGIGGKALVLVCTAAWYHDLGFVEQRHPGGLLKRLNCGHERRQ